jgi:hypothetical protein
MIPCNLAERYQHLENISFTLKMETANVGNNLPDYMASFPEYIQAFYLNKKELLEQWK